jgi:hypothetical protein
MKRKLENITHNFLGGIIFNYWRGSEKQIDIFPHPGEYLKPLSSNKTDLMENI